MADIVRTPAGVLSYPRLFTPRPRVEGGQPVYTLNLIFDQNAQATPEFQAMRKAVHDAIIEKWGQAKANDPKFIKMLMLPFRPCADKADSEGYDVEGGVFVGAWSKNPPGVVDSRLQPMVESDVWGGQIARATLRPFAWERSGKRGVSFGLNNVQILRADMPAFGGGRRKPEDDFEAVGSSDDNADDVPF